MSFKIQSKTLDYFKKNYNTFKEESFFDEKANKRVNFTIVLIKKIRYRNQLEKLFTEKVEDIVNFDEVAVFFEMGKDTTLDIKGEHVVSKISSGKDKARITVIIVSTLSGKAFPPIVIYKSMAKTHIPHLKANALKEAEKYWVIIRQNENGWNNSELPNIKNLMTNNSTNSSKWLLIMDNCPCHCSGEVIKKLKDLGIN